MIRGWQRPSGDGERPASSFSARPGGVGAWSTALLSACFWFMVGAASSPLESHRGSNAELAASTPETEFAKYRMCLQTLTDHPERAKDGRAQDEIILEYGFAVLMVAEERGRHDHPMQEALIEEFHRHTKGKCR